jgi:hypothetical protein
VEADFYSDSAVRKTLTAGDGERSGSPGSCDSRLRVLFDAARHAFSGRVTATPSSIRSSLAGAAPGATNLQRDELPTTRPEFKNRASFGLNERAVFSRADRITGWRANQSILSSIASSEGLFFPENLNRVHLGCSTDRKIAPQAGKKPQNDPTPDQRDWIGQTRFK